MSWFQIHPQHPIFTKLPYPPLQAKMLFVGWEAHDDNHKESTDGGEEESEGGVEEERGWWRRGE